MRRHSAALRKLVEPMEDARPIEERVARLETDVAHIKTGIADIKLDVRELRGDMKAANDSIASLRSDVSGLRGEIKADIHGLETRMIKWLIGTVLTVTAVVFSIARFVG